MRKPKEILELEEAYGIELTETKDSGLLHQNTYIQSDGEIIRINLQDNNIYNLNALTKISSIEELNISRNKIKNLGAIRRLRNLRFLDISHNPIESLGLIFDCKRIEDLSISSPSSVVISELQRFVWIKSLKITYCDDLYKIDFGKFAKLESLSISSAKKFNFKWITQNQSLDFIMFHSIEEVHNFSLIKNFKQLEYLYLFNSNLKEVPNLDELIYLKVLDLSNNEIVDISNIGELQSSFYVNLGGNNIKDLSKAKHLLLNPNISSNFNGNPLQENLIAILEGKDEFSRISALKKYFADLEKGNKTLNEAKLMILGEGEAGKSNLRNYLLGRNFDDHKSATVGIAIERWHIQDEAKENYRINVWDFGGQWLQQQVHKFFITEECVYIIMLKARTEDNPVVWLDWIKTYAPESQAIIVINRMDELSGQSYSLTENTLRENYPFIVSFHYISLRKANWEQDQDAKVKVNELRIAVEKELLQLPNIKAPTPTNYFNLKTEIEDTYFEQRPFISMELFEELVKQKEIIGDTSDLLKTFNRIGTLRYFEKTGRHILNPEWLSAGVYKLITSHRTEQLKGILNESDFPAILAKLENDAFEYGKNDYAYLLSMMDEFNLAYVDPKTKNCFIPKQFDKDIPLVLTKEELFTEDYIHYYFQYEGYFPDSLISQFIAEKYGKLYKDYYWQQGIVLQDKDEDCNDISLAFVRADIYNKKIDIKVKGEHKRTFFKEIKNALLDLQKDIAFNYKEYIVDINTGTPIDYKKMLTFYKNGKNFYEDVTPAGEMMALSIDQLLGIVQTQRETQKQVQTVINDHRTYNYHVGRDYNERLSHHNTYNFYELAPEYNNQLDTLDKAIHQLTEANQLALQNIVTELDAVPKEKEPEKAKTIFQKALDRLNQFDKTIASETEKEAAKAIIRRAWQGLTEIYNSISWDDAISKFASLWEKGKDLLGN